MPCLKPRRIIIARRGFDAERIVYGVTVFETIIRVHPISCSINGETIDAVRTIPVSRISLLRVTRFLFSSVLLFHDRFARFFLYFTCPLSLSLSLSHTRFTKLRRIDRCRFFESLASVLERVVSSVVHARVQLDEFEKIPVRGKAGRGSSSTSSFHPIGISRSFTYSSSIRDNEPTLRNIALASRSIKTRSRRSVSWPLLLPPFSGHSLGDPL